MHQLISLSLLDVVAGSSQLILALSQVQCGTAHRVSSQRHNHRSVVIWQEVLVKCH